MQSPVYHCMYFRKLDTRIQAAKLRMLTNYNFFVMLKANTQTAAEGQVTGYTSPLHQMFFAQSFSNQEHSKISIDFTRLRDGATGVRFSWDFIEPADTGRMQLVKTSHSVMKTLPRTRFHVQRSNYPPSYQGQYS